MKKLSLSLFLLLACAFLLRAQGTKARLADGLYVVLETAADAASLSPAAANEALLGINKQYIAADPQEPTHLRVATSEYVPLELQRVPKVEAQADKTMKLLLSLTPDAATLLRQFTEKNLNKMVAIVVDGEALTLHKVKAVITGGALQVTRCKDNACEALCIRLRDSVKN